MTNARLLTITGIALSTLAGIALGVVSRDDSLHGKCKRGDGAACGVLGDRLRSTSGASAEVQKACDYYRQACTNGHYLGCANLGAFIAQERCTGAKGEALAVLDRACAHDDVTGCNNLGTLLRDGAEDAPRDITRAEASFRKACPRSATACESLGALLIETDAARATAALQAGCDSKQDANARAVAGCCYKLGLSYQHGLGIPVDAARAKSLYTLSCTQSVPDACYQLGLLELEGDADLPGAATHFRKACDLGAAPGCNNLGLMYSTGQGVPPNPALAVQYLQRSCDGGELRACANVGSRYVLGDGVPAAPAKGRELMAKACAGGVTEACEPPVPREP
jgi:TPR repeat protein